MIMSLTSSGSCLRSFGVSSRAHLHASWAMNRAGCSRLIAFCSLLSKRIQCAAKTSSIGSTSFRTSHTRLPTTGNTRCRKLLSTFTCKHKIRRQKNTYFVTDKGWTIDFFFFNGDFGKDFCGLLSRCFCPVRSNSVACFICRHSTAFCDVWQRHACDTGACTYATRTLGR